MSGEIGAPPDVPGSNPSSAQFLKASVPPLPRLQNEILTGLVGGGSQGGTGIKSRTQTCLLLVRVILPAEPVCSKRCWDPTCRTQQVCVDPVPRAGLSHTLSTLIPPSHPLEEHPSFPSMTQRISNGWCCPRAWPVEMTSFGLQQAVPSRGAP